MKGIEQSGDHTESWFRENVRPRVREFLRNAFDSEYANATSALKSAAQSEGFIFLTIHRIGGNQSARIPLKKEEADKVTIAHFEQFAVNTSYNFSLSIRDRRGIELASLQYPRPGGIAERINRYLDIG